ncbi:hypothetical protein ACFXK0_15900 [Nocardia sp. NPDC059177]|uniref:hypothetical protein n=1 Tax=Nocardia sp. NPDC059177 TaxID=3346759 RepID=UPI00369233E5
MDDYRNKLDTAIANEVGAGARLEYRGEVNAVVILGNKPNHILHLILSIVSCGLWLPMWALVAWLNYEERVMLAVDESGQLSRKVLPTGVNSVITRPAR